MCQFCACFSFVYVLLSIVIKFLLAIYLTNKPLYTKCKVFQIPMAFLCSDCCVISLTHECLMVNPMLLIFYSQNGHPQAWHNILIHD